MQSDSGPDAFATWRESTFDATSPVGESEDYRNARALKWLAPSLAKLEKANKKFLEQKKTGILFLSVKQPCNFEIKKSKNEVYIMSADDRDKLAKACPARNFQGEAQHFSFRLKRYTTWEQADLSFSGKALYSNGIFANGVVSTLGNVPIDTLNLDSKGISGHRDIVPAKNPQERAARMPMSMMPLRPMAASDERLATTKRPAIRSDCVSCPKNLAA